MPEHKLVGAVEGLCPNGHPVEKLSIRALGALLTLDFYCPYCRAQYTAHVQTVRCRECGTRQPTDADEQAHRLEG